jgi:DNA helicase IV
VKQFPPIFSASGKLPKDKRKKTKALNVEALEILWRVYRGEPPFSMPSRTTFFVANDAITSDDVERLKTGRMTEEGKINIRERVVGIVKTLTKEVTRSSGQRPTALRMVADSVLIQDEIRRVETGELTESERISIRRKLDQGLKALGEQLTGSRERVSLFLQDAIDFANRLMNVHELPVLRAGRLLTLA